MTKGEPKKANVSPQHQVFGLTSLFASYSIVFISNQGGLKGKTSKRRDAWERKIANMAKEVRFRTCEAVFKLAPLTRSPATGP